MRLFALFDRDFIRAYTTQHQLVGEPVPGEQAFQERYGEIYQA